MVLSAIVGLSVLLMNRTAIAVQPGPDIRLWSGDAPGSKGSGTEDVPTLTPYIPAHPNGAAFIVCPGGGYGMLAAHEGGPPAEFLNSLGITAFVLKYRLGPKYHNPAEMDDVMRAIRYVRFHRGDYGVQTDKIGIMGFSAGGHLAGTAATLFDAGDPTANDPIDKVSSRPDLAVLVYPVISMKPPFGHMGSRQNLMGDHPSASDIERFSLEDQVTANTPPTFLVTTDTDDVVPMENAVGFMMACRKNHVPVEFHMFEKGPHGFGLGNDDVTKQWPPLCANWLIANGFGPAK